MTQLGKLESYKQYMTAKGIGEATAFPPAWVMLWSIGVKIPPPPFLGFVSLALITGGIFGPLFGLGAWLLGNRGFRQMPATKALWVALFTGAVFGLIMAAYYRQMARKHRLGSWARFSA
ncbi:MAG: DUF6404 family protein [Rhodoferax sp.]